MSETGPLTVGFDLDMTLVDTVPGFAATLRGCSAPSWAWTSRSRACSPTSGRRSTRCWRRHLPAEEIGPAGDRFRELYPDTAVPAVPALPGAHEALAAVRRERGRTVVVTGKYPANARRHLDHLGLDVDVLEGWVWGVGKADGAAARGREHLRRRPRARRRGRPRPPAR